MIEKMKIALIGGIVVIILVAVFFLLGFLRKGPGERAQISANNHSYEYIK